MTGRMRDRHQDHSYTERYANIFKKTLQIYLITISTQFTAAASHTLISHTGPLKGTGNTLASDF